MYYKNPPENFSPIFEVVGCLIEYDGAILLLRRNQQKEQGGQVGMPAGKIDAGEDPLSAIQREIKEEAGISVDKEKIEFVQKMYERYPDYDFIYHLYKTRLEGAPKVILNPVEHTDYIWLTPEKVLEQKDLIEDLDECIRIAYF
jgi:8-oxo-dGTP pyrophosphatase MutT (NUDIX family)